MDAAQKKENTNFSVVYLDRKYHMEPKQMREKIIEAEKNRPEYEKVQAYASAFVAYTLYGWIDAWFQRGMRQSSDEIAEMFKTQGL